jgi:transposase
VGTLIALTYLLTLEDPNRFRKSRDVGCYVGLQPGRPNSGQSEPQMHISKEGDPYLRTLLVQGAHHIRGPFGVHSDLRRWGLKLAERGGKNGKKRAVIATARKAGGVAASAVGEWRSVRTGAQQSPNSAAGGRIGQNLLRRKKQEPKAEFR